MGLRAYILKRTIYSLVLLVFVLVLNFTIFELMPGDPATLFMPPIKITPEQQQTIREHWGLTDPFHVKLGKYMLNMVTWQFGDSYKTRRPINQEIGFFLGNTLLLMGLSTILSIVIGVILGVIAAHQRGKIFDTASVTTSLITFSLPTFWMGMVAILIFYRNLAWFPVGKAQPAEWTLLGRAPIPLLTLSFPNTQLTIPGTQASLNIPAFGFAIPGFVEITTRLWYLFLPLSILTLFQYGGFLLLARATMLEALSEDYVVTARAKGVKERTVLFKHALKNASLPLITNAAISLGFILSGAIITETVFSWPGLGNWIWTAIGEQNYPVLQAIFYIIALCVIIANFLADLLYGVMDPRIKYG